jgi:acetoin utilization deacetylase AcuC-like enzyme
VAGEVQGGLSGERGVAPASEIRPSALYFSHPACLAHDPREGMPGHPESPERLRAIERYLGERDWLGWERREAPAASEVELRLVHTERHVKAVRELCRSGGGAIDADTYAGPESYEAALRAAGAACEMTRTLMAGEARTGFCAVRPAGHHAEPDRAMGFCLFNNVAIAAELAIRELAVERVLVVDWDVHHGNGTVAAFRERDDVLVAGIHERGIYPGTGSSGDAGSGAGEDYTIDLPVPGGSEEDVWLSLLDERIEPAAVAFKPELILVSAGFDAHRDDPLATCRLEAASFGRMAARVRELGRTLGAPVGAVLEGGYSPPALAESVAATIAALDGDGDDVSAEGPDAPGEEHHTPEA